MGVRLGGPQGRIATRSIPNVFRVQQQPPAFVSRLGQVQVARREIVVEVLPDATTGQINHMLASVQGGIVASVKGARLLLVAIPDPQTVRALKGIVSRVSRIRGVASAQVQRDGEARRCTAEGVGATLEFPKESARPPAG